MTSAASGGSTDKPPAVESAPWSIVGRLDQYLRIVVAAISAVLLTVEIIILLVGVVARYVFHKPIYWGDELASFVFLWLIMFGAVLAMQRGEHLRMTAFLHNASPERRQSFDAFAMLSVMAFVVLLLPVTYRYAAHEGIMTSPALGLPGSWRAAAIPFGFTLLLVATIIELAKSFHWRQLVVPAAALVAIGATAWLVSPYLEHAGNYKLLVYFVIGVGAAIILGVHIAFAFGLTSLAYLAFHTHGPLTIVVNRMNEGMSHTILLSVPMFIFLGVLIDITGMARSMVGALTATLGHIRGGLHYALLGAMYLVSGISGSKAADMAATAPILFPEMRRRGTKPGELVALLSASGAMSETIPPSIVLIAVGSVTGVSIAALFIAGLLPAFILALALGLFIHFRRRHDDIPSPRATRSQIARAFVVAVPALILPFLIRGAVVEGVATATEVATIGVAYAAIVTLLITWSFPWRECVSQLISSASLSGSILIIFGAATAMSWAITQSGFSSDLADFMKALPGGATTFLVVSIVIFILLGSLLEGIPAIILLGPLLFPIARDVGIHEVHYSMVAILAMGVGLFAPPFGVGYYYACAIGKIDPNEGMRTIWPYMLVITAGVFLVAAVPWISIGFL
jgi:tripartite ATP-independent transporter DctM subunit